MSSVPNQFRIGRSARYAALSTVLHAGAAALLVCALSRLSPLLTMLLLILLALALQRDLASVAWRDANDAVVLMEVHDGHWRLWCRSGKPFGPAVLETYRGASAGVLLVLRDGHGSRERVLLPADCVSAADLRRIRVHAHAALAGARA